jgi:hypothetical protein
LRTQRKIAAFFLLTSVLLGGLVAPLSHFAYMAFSDAYAGHDMALHDVAVSHASMVHAEGQAVDADSDTEHLECPYAAFFLNQASAVSSDAPGLTQTHSSTCLTVAPASVPHEVSVHILPIRGPPGHSA